MEQKDTAQAELERQRRRIAQLEEHIERMRAGLDRLRQELEECRQRVSQCNKQVGTDTPAQTVGDTQMAYSTRATINAVRARLERVEADMRDTVEHERAAAIQRQSQNARVE